MSRPRFRAVRHHATPGLFDGPTADVLPEPSLAPAPDPSAAALLDRIGALEEQVATLGVLLSRVHDLVTAKVVAKEFYTTAEAAGVLGKRPYTVREWCRQGRVNAIKTYCGRGEGEEWRIPHDELTRIQNEGLLPIAEH